MYRVVIIDDEPIIVRGLSQMVPWEKYQCEVAGTASDGQEGLEMVRRLRPDMVISDIYMPKMDGLLMAAALKSEFEDMELSILTGYRDFELLQQALRLGVTRFVLKPTHMEEIEEAVEAMTLRLKKKGILPDGHAVQPCPLDGLSEEEGGLPGETDRDGDLPVETAGDGGASGKNVDDGGLYTGAVREASDNFIVNNALAYIRANYARRLTLTEVAEHTYVSQWHLSKLLNRHMQQNFSEILNTIRVEKARELLKDPSLRVGDVGEAVGFVDMAHFSRVFKKITGISANEYRNRL